MPVSQEIENVLAAADLLSLVYSAASRNADKDKKAGKASSLGTVILNQKEVFAQREPQTT